MFTAEPMRYVTLYLMSDDLSRASLLLADLGVLDPQAAATTPQLPEGPARAYRETYQSLALRLEKIERLLDLRAEIAADAVADRRTAANEAPDERQLQVLYQQLGPIWQECSRCEESMRQVLEQQQLLRQQE
ncbi:MAG: hypothetical protein ABFS23_13015, partial [Pseudomonadota bacterium]